MPTPLIIQVFRGDTVESSHQVHCMVMDRDGDVAECRGDAGRMISPRSSLKPLQALPLVESGALDAFGLGDEEIALACASHNAEKMHIGAVRGWLKKIGLAEEDLACGGHLSINQERAHEMIRKDIALTALYSDCSGKHAGMLTTARHLGEPVEGYAARTHPVQLRIFETISEMAGYDLSKGASGTDGCSVPNPSIPLEKLVRAFSCFLNPARVSSARAAACARILDAMAAQPYLVAGRDRFDTVIAELSKGNLIGKAGAEGNYVLFVRDKGLVIYLKAEDGILHRATLPAVGHVLEKLGAWNDGLDAALSGFTRPVLKNWTGLEIGRVAVAS